MLPCGSGICCYVLFCFLLLLSIPFLYFFFLNLASINRRNGPRYQRVLAYVLFFFNRGGTEGTNSSKILCPMFLYVLFHVNLCHD